MEVGRESTTAGYHIANLNRPMLGHSEMDSRVTMARPMRQTVQEPVQSEKI